MNTLRRAALWVVAGIVVAAGATFVRSQAPASTEAEIVLIVPADAEVLFNGKATTQTGTERLFSTPPLDKDSKSYYDVVVRWKEDGKTVERARRIDVSPGAKLRIEIKGGAPTKPEPPKPEEPIDEETFKLAVEAYIYGYPLVTMELTRRVMTNVAAPEGTHAPMGEFANMRTYPTAAFKDVTAPNADTLYSAAWLDLAKEPYVLSIPDAKDRYYLMPMLDGWTDVFQVPGKRTTGTKPQQYAITGPGWKGKLPGGVEEYKSPTSLVWILGRTYCTGTPEDYKEVHAFQDKLSLVPLSAYGKEDYTPPKGAVEPNIDMKMPVREQVNRLKAGAYFKLLATLLKDNPPAPRDGPLVTRLAKIGLIPGQDFDVAKLNPGAVRGLDRAPAAAQQQIMAHEKDAGKKVNGWIVSTKTGEYGTAYLHRAYVTAVGLGANRPDDAVYPMTQVDGDGKRLSGANRYVLHFDKGQTPPAAGFWSLTMYNDQYFFVENALNRYTVSPRNDLKTNDDGSVDLYFQHESPGKDKESNWLPAPKGDFNLMLRLYWPNEKDPSILDGTWQPPAVKKVP